MNKKTIIKLIILNLIIIIATVVIYSPGLIALRFSDEGILRPGLFIIMILILGFTFIYGNYLLLKEKKHKIVNEISTMKDAEDILKSYMDGKYFGKTASTAYSQIKRINDSAKRCLTIIKTVFEPNSISYDQYQAILKTATDASLENIRKMANRMSMFNENEYDKLQNYQNDDIPDDIQEDQIAILNKNKEKIDEMISVNEKIIVKLDTLTMELQDEKTDESILDEIKELTNKVKYYK